MSDEIGKIRNDAKTGGLYIHKLTGVGSKDQDYSHILEFMYDQDLNGLEIYLDGKWMHTIMF